MPPPCSDPPKGPVRAKTSRAHWLHLSLPLPNSPRLVRFGIAPLCNCTPRDAVGLAAARWGGGPVIRDGAAG